MKIVRSYSVSRWDYFFKNPHVSEHVRQRVLNNNGKPHIYWWPFFDAYIQVSLSV